MSRVHRFAEDPLVILAWEAILAILIAIAVFIATTQLESAIAERQQQQADDLARRAEVLENVRFVREATLTGSRKIYAGMDLASGDFSGLDLSCPQGESDDKLKVQVARLRDKARNCADLSFAKLRGAAFSGTLLAGADLSGADLTNAAFTSADLRGVDFTGATLDGASFRAVCHGRATIWPTKFEAPRNSQATCNERDADVAVARLILRQKIEERREIEALLGDLQGLRHESATNLIERIR
jgi:hypothetical protein